MRCNGVAPAGVSWLQLREQCRAFSSTLLSLFQRHVLCLTCGHSLAHRTIRIGGVENVGNSCIFSTMLQDFAALPQIYDSLFSTPLQRGLNEPATRFAARQAVQRMLWRCVEKIRSGQKVRHAEVRALADLLQKLGWRGHFSSAWRCFLHRLAPGLFSLPHFSVYELYEKTLHCLVGQMSSIPLQVVLTGKPNSLPFSAFFASHPEFPRMRVPSLWRISLNTSPALMEENFQIGLWKFSLRLVHAYRNTPSGKHVIVYRKSGEEWVCCNDTQITRAAPSATDSIYTVVYESRLSNSASVST